MIGAIIGLSAIFIILAFVLTVNNAKYLLAGYNTMSLAERERVDIKGLIAYFKRFFIFLGVSFLIIGLIASQYLSQNYAAIFICIYPIVACIYFIIRSQKFYKNS